MTTSKLSAFPPEFEQFFIQAATRRVEIPLDSERAAYRLRYRLNFYRKILREEDHPLANIANQVTIRMRGSTIIGEPVDAEFVEVLTKEGLGMQDPFK